MDLPLPTRIASLALPTRETHTLAMVWPRGGATVILVAELNLASAPRQELQVTLLQTLEQTLPGIETMAADHGLERLLLALNQVLASHERLLGNPLAPRYHLGVGMLSGETLALAGLGHVTGFVTQRNRLTAILEPPRGSRGTAATFQNFVSGHLEPGEAFILTTPALFDCVAPERVRATLTSRAPGPALRELEQQIVALPHHPPLAAIVLKAAAEAATTTGASLDHLLATQRQTDQLLKPTLWSFLGSRLRATLPSRPHPAQPEPTPGSAKAPTELPAAGSDAAGAPVAEPPAQVAAKRATPRPPRLSLRDRTDRFIRRANQALRSLHWLASRSEAKAHLSWAVEGRLAAWRKLDSLKRIALVAALVCLVGFSQSIVSQGRGHELERDSELYNRAAARLTELAAEAEAALIYHDDARARALLREARGLLAALSQNTAAREQQAKALEKNLGFLARRIERRLELTQLPAWADLPEPRLGGSWGGLVLVGGQVWVWGPGELREVTEKGTMGRDITLPDDTRELRAATGMASQILLARVNGDPLLVPLKGGAPVATKLGGFTAGATYQGKLYLLQGEPAQVMRAAAEGATLASPTRWLRSGERAGVASASGIAVDGAVYVSSALGLKKYVQGIERTLALDAVDPPLRNLSGVAAAAEAAELYTWSRSDRRLLVLDKLGKLQLQLVLPESSQLRDIAIDLATKRAYILAGNSIHRLELGQLTP